jgi:hypothetical protein
VSFDLHSFISALLVYLVIFDLILFTSLHKRNSSLLTSTSISQMQTRRESHYSLSSMSWCSLSTSWFGSLSYLDCHTAYGEQEGCSQWSHSKSSKRLRRYRSSLEDIWMSTQFRTIDNFFCRLFFYLFLLCGELDNSIPWQKWPIGSCCLELRFEIEMDILLNHSLIALFTSIDFVIFRLKSFFPFKTI